MPQQAALRPAEPPRYLNAPLVASRALAEPVILPLAERREPRPVLGYAMVMTAATLWAVNGTVSKVILATGLSSLRLAEVRSTGAFLLLAIGLAAARPEALRLRARELPYFIVFGAGGLALVQWFYFLAIHRLQVGIALLIQYLAPVLIALWARYVFHEEVRARIWVALVFALTGLALVVEIWSGLSLSAAGVAASLGAAVAYSLYVLMAEHRVGDRDPISLVCFGFLFASLLWALVQPWWSFPAGVVGESVSLHGHLSSLHLPVWLLIAWMIVLGTIVPFALLVSALRYIPATRAGIVAMLEPVAGTIVAWAWLGESLRGVQLFGASVVLAAIFLAQTAR
jgi:drug/metabolite transporter (DMT)-like permease